MEDLHVIATENTPEIIGNSQTGELSISGKCYPTNSLEFCGPLKTWLKQLFDQGLESHNLILDLEYFNTSSSVILLDLMKSFKKNNSLNQIVWIFEEEDAEMIEAGEEYNLILRDGLKMVSKPSINQQSRA